MKKIISKFLPVIMILAFSWFTVFLSCSSLKGIMGKGGSTKDKAATDDIDTKREAAKGNGDHDDPKSVSGLDHKKNGGKKHTRGKPSRDTSKTYHKKRPSGPSGLKAGYADDNRQFNYFIGFLKKYKAQHYKIKIGERIKLRLLDRNSKPIPNAEVKIYAKSRRIAVGKTYADGSFLFFPSEFGKDIHRYEAHFRYNQSTKKVKIDRQGRREITVKWKIGRPVMDNVPLDILFILDTTGSMGEEIQRLKKTIEIINLNLSNISSKPMVRFGMVLYKDRNEIYVTRVIPLTSDLDKFQAELDRVAASGGGDLEEDLQSALYDSVKNINWDMKGIRLAFIITDAPPHLNYGQKHNYVWSAKRAKEMGIKIFSVGTGGLDINGEYVLRQISQYTSAKYIFLTYGERGESAGGKPGGVSHHTGANFKTDKLEAIIIRFAKEELSHISDIKIDDGDEHFNAIMVPDEKKEETLQKLFKMSIDQLADYSSIGIRKKTTAGILPIISTDKRLKLNSEYFTEQLIFSLSKSGRFKIVERKDIQKILKELELQMTGLTDEKNAAKVGKFMGARMLIIGKLYKKRNSYELFLKLVRVQTAEVLSVTKAKIGVKLGL